MRYHYLSYSYADSTVHSGAEYDANSIFVFDSFLKKNLDIFAKKDKEELKKFITSYINHLENFGESFFHLIQASKSNIRLYKLFVIWHC